MWNGEWGGYYTRLKDLTGFQNLSGLRKLYFAPSQICFCHLLRYCVSIFAINLEQFQQDFSYQRNDKKTQFMTMFSICCQSLIFCAQRWQHCCHVSFLCFCLLLDTVFIIYLYHTNYQRAVFFAHLSFNNLMPFPFV